VDLHACLCFGLDLAEQDRSGFGSGYSVYQAEYSRNPRFTIGAQLDHVFDRIVDRTRSRWTGRSCGPCSAPNNASAATAPPTYH
jgi:hypothetical protein